MVLELRTEEYFLGCDGGNRYDAKLLYAVNEAFAVRQK